MYYCEDTPQVHKNGSKQQMDNAQRYAMANLPLPLTAIKLLPVCTLPPTNSNH